VIHYVYCPLYYFLFFYMFNFRDAFTYIFKEKDWPLKLGLPILVQLLVVIPSAIYSFLNLDSSDSSFYSNSYNYLPATATRNPGLETMALAFSCFILLTIIPTIIISLWYAYENTQAGIQLRSTKAIWSNNFSDTLKKVGKYFIVNLAYSIVILIIFAIFAAIFFGLFCAGAALLGSLGANANAGLSSFQNTGKLDPSLFAGAGIIGVLLLCCFGIVALVVSIVAYLFIMPAMLRLIGTNTLGEGLKFGENWEIGKKYKGDFLGLLGIVILFAFIYGVINGFLSLFAGIFMVAAPGVGLVVSVIVQTITSIGVVYFSSFVYTRLSGQMFRHIAQKEPLLKGVVLGDKTTKVDDVVVMA